MTHMCFNVEAEIIIECVSKPEENGCCRYSPTKEEECRDTHCSDWEAIQQFSLMPDPGQRTDEKRKSCEYSGYDKGCSEPT